MRGFFEAQYPYSGNRGSFAPAVADYVEDVVLAADTLVRVPIPAGARFALFSFDGDFRLRLGVSNTTFALPSATSTNGTGSILNPAARRIPETLGDGTTVPTHLCLRAPAACKGSIEFYGG
ncbi:hypothetical protein [Enterovirga aerilata]|uniref:Uncharacterized protein n=1 Tax=Enterovirga aerilata TaxID=2730920 RepID=A0A849ICU0_9HYPH|nr:hypothetical protein [Enterovirga sp. DB1703]NNM75081.1 hypothetical protein [Enterovirga sp. DB1703]